MPTWLRSVSFLPGPASSQVGFSLGILRGNGLLGGLAAWFAFTMPWTFSNARISICRTRSRETPLGAAFDPNWLWNWVRGGTTWGAAHQQTTVQGIYAAGDVVSDLHRIAVATGRGAIAATHIHKSLQANLR
jgi:hypothetical protein